MSFNGTADSSQLSMLTRVLDDYCTQAGIALGHPARQHAGHRIMELFAAGVNNPEDLAAAMNTGYDEWLGEIDVPRFYTPEPISIDHVEPDRADGTLPGSNRRGK